ncbi:MAG: hypothetical protein JWO02_4371 [Solirubrobacterales bacterium]|nr:hypothetical protein [Solirubrobacterales bacterium]
MLALLWCSAAQAKPVLGIADQKPATFLDARLEALNLKYARVYVPWDVLQDKGTLPVIDEWFAGAKLDGLAPLVTISRSRIPSRLGYKPSPAQLAGEFKRWRQRWPGQVDTISTWNEANLGNKPEMVASWWLALRKACPSCTVLGADLLDEPKVLAWAAKFVKAAKRAPAIWGLHAYNDANTFKTTITQALLNGVKGDFWITETGGVANRVRPIYKFAGCGVAHQTKATTFLLSNIAMLSPRIKRIYIFTWGLGDNRASFDSALIDAEGRERPSLNVVRGYLGQTTLAAPFGGFSPELKSCNKGKSAVKALKNAATKTSKVTKTSKKSAKKK